MNKHLNHWIIFILVGLSSAMWAAEADKKGKIKGQLLDKDGITISYAEVDLLLNGKIITGAISDEDGNFNIEPTDYGTYTLSIKAIGYKTLSKEITIEQAETNMGSIVLSASTIELNEARVEVSQIRQEIDKRVVEVGKDLVNAGATAVEVLDRVPSLSVDQQSGELSLRGNSNVRVFVDGKPSNIPVSQLLRQLPSNAIKQVEIITNPSAKYDPEGNSGIINIITNKGKRKGYNISTDIGYTAAFRQNYNAGISGNYNTGKLNLFANYNTNFGERVFKGDINNLDTQLQQTVNSVSDNASHLVKFGFDWFINDKTALTIYTNQSFYDSDDINTSTLINNANNGSNLNLTESETDNHNQDYSLNFKRDFNKEKHSIELDAFFSYANNQDLSDYNWESAGALGLFNQSIDRSVNNTRINLDYVNPVLEKGKIETGIQFRNESIENNFLTNQNIASLGQLQDGFYDFNRDIYSAYLNFGYQWDKFGIQLGTRLESVQENGLFQSFGSNTIADDNQRIKNNYVELYPSAFLTYDLSKRTQVSLNYSRRVDRPGIGQLNPIRNFQTAVVRSVGNPNLLPQFTNNYEIGFLRRFKKGKGSLNASVFYRDIKDNITRFLEVDDENPTGTTTLLQYTNVDDNESYGIELSGFYKALKWWSLNASFDLYNNKFLGPDANNPNGLIEVDNTVYNFRISNDFKVTKTINLQLFSMYRGRNDFLQGTQNPMFKLDFGARKSFAKGKGSISARVSDIFDTFNFDGDITNPFVQKARFNWGAQQFFIGLNYSFGGEVKTRADKQRNKSNQNSGGGIGF